MKQTHVIQIRQRIESAAHYNVWRDVPEPFPSLETAIAWAKQMKSQSQSLDIRVNAVYEIRNEGEL